MSNVDKAAELIGQDLAEPLSERLADNLAEAGLLAPDLPQPEFEFDGGACWLDSENASVESHYFTDSGESIITAGVAYDLTPAEARSLAFALLAAANHAEEKINE